MNQKGDRYLQLFLLKPQLAMPFLSIYTQQLKFGVALVGKDGWVGLEKLWSNLS
jgi:hypothetical protein